MSAIDEFLALRRICYAAARAGTGHGTGSPAAQVLRLPGRLTLSEVGRSNVARQLICMLSIKGKSNEQLAHEAWEAYQMYLEAETGPGVPAGAGPETGTGVATARARAQHGLRGPLADETDCPRVLVPVGLS